MPPQSYDLASGELTPVGMPGDALITDPAGGFAISDDRAQLRGLPPADRATPRASSLGVVAGRPALAEPLIAAAPPPTGARCPELSAEQRADRGGFRVLAWSARGVLLARGQALSLLALDAPGAARGPRRELPDSEAASPACRRLERAQRGRPLPRALDAARPRDPRSPPGATRLLALPEARTSPSPMSRCRLRARASLCAAARALFVGVPAQTCAVHPAPPRTPSP